MIWPDGREKRKEDWRRGTMPVPLNWWWHQHCVVSKEPAQHLALKLSSKRNKIERNSNGTLRSVRYGGTQINYEDFPAELMAELKGILEEECSRRSTPVNMTAVSDI
jgi:hypothetical protein